MGEGTTRVVETNGDAGRVGQLDGEITDVRHRLDSLVVELDRRRHNVTNWKHHLRRHSGSLAIGVVAFAAALATPLALAQRRARRRRILGVAPDVLRMPARRLTQALAQVTRPAERHEPPPPTALRVGQSTVVGMLLMVAQVVVTSLVREALERRRT